MGAVRYRKIILFQNPASGGPNPELRRRVRDRLEAISDSLTEVMVDRELNLAGRAAETAQRMLTWSLSRAETAPFERWLEPW